MMMFKNKSKLKTRNKKKITILLFDFLWFAICRLIPLKLLLFKIANLLSLLFSSFFSLCFFFRKICSDFSHGQHFLMIDFMFDCLLALLLLWQIVRIEMQFYMIIFLKNVFFFLIYMLQQLTTTHDLHFFFILFLVDFLFILTYFA